MKIIQIVPTLNYGDAIGNHVIAIKHIIEKMGYKTAIYCYSFHEKITEPNVCLISTLKDLKSSDIVIYHMSIGSELNRQVADFKCRKIMIYHNITPPHFFEIDSYDKVEMCRNGLADVKALAGKFDYCIADSSFNRQDLINMGYDGDKIDVISIMVAMDDYKSTPDQSIIDHYNDGYTNILFVGRVAPNKKHEDMIRAFAYYKKNINPKSRLILAGSHDDQSNYYNYLTAYIEKIGVRDIEFTSHISFAGILALYKTADVFLCLSEHEGFCVPLIEAMIFDVPIIAYSSCAVPETMGESGIVVENKSPVFLSKVIDAVINDENLRKCMIESERKRLEDFKYAPLSKQFQEALEKFIGNVKKKA